MRILITGGAGFIGSHVADFALGAGHEVAVVDNLSAGKRENVPGQATFFQTDVRRRDEIMKIFREWRPDVVSHQAAQASVSVSVRDPLLDADINIVGSLNVMDAARAAKVRRFVFASTGGAIYGDVPEGRRADLSWRPDPLSPYACSKLAVERYLILHRSLYDLDYRILRYANVYGPRQDPYGEAGVVAIFLDRMLAGRCVQVNAMAREGDDGCVRDYVYVEDVARANLAAMTGDSMPPTANIATGIGTTTLQLVRQLEVAIERKVEVRHAPPRAGDVARSVLAPTESAGPSTTLSAGLAETLRWFRKRRETASIRP
ncbi:MAG: NAD-dependent epimerase/dehydratase family protein [Planctomycetes bacterium]|nr:NAD-dependent epimerase/dehydratase family protein [Planctomycetota bacterium]